MPITYTCEGCGVTADSLDGWKMVSVVYLYEDPHAAFPPGGRTIEGTAPDILFHAAECRDAWRAKHELREPRLQTFRPPINVG